MAAGIHAIAGDWGATTLKTNCVCVFPRVLLAVIVYVVEEAGVAGFPLAFKLPVLESKLRNAGTSGERL
jgi:hypothetical protein